MKPISDDLKLIFLLSEGCTHASELREDIWGKNFKRRRVRALVAKCRERGWPIDKVEDLNGRPAYQLAPLAWRYVQKAIKHDFLHSWIQLPRVDLGHGRTIGH